MALMTFIAGFLQFTFLGVMYFFPTLIAYYRRNADLMLIMIVNIFFAWTVIGWLLVLLWAFFDRTKRRLPR